MSALTLAKWRCVEIGGTVTEDGQPVYMDVYGMVREGQIKNLKRVGGHGRDPKKSARKPLNYLFGSKYGG